MKRLLTAAFAVLCLVTIAQAQVTKDTVQGITNLARVETTVACAGAVTPSAVSEIINSTGNGFGAVFPQQGQVIHRLQEFLRSSFEVGLDVQRWMFEVHSRAL